MSRRASFSLVGAAMALLLLVVALLPARAGAINCATSPGGVLELRDLHTQTTVDVDGLGPSCRRITIGPNVTLLTLQFTEPIVGTTSITIRNVTCDTAIIQSGSAPRSSCTFCLSTLLTRDLALGSCNILIHPSDTAHMATALAPVSH